MRTLTFPYKRYRSGIAPIVPIRVFAGRRWRKVWAYVDSGAAVSILTVTEARRLGLMKIKAKKVAITTSGGRTNRISLHRLWVKLDKKRFSITFGVPRGFDIGFNLLGRKDLFQQYVISFNESKGRVSFTPNTG